MSQEDQDLGAALGLTDLQGGMVSYGALGVSDPCVSGVGVFLVVMRVGKGGIYVGEWVCDVYFWAGGGRGGVMCVMCVCACVRKWVSDVVMCCGLRGETSSICRAGTLTLLRHHKHVD